MRIHLAFFSLSLVGAHVFAADAVAPVQPDAATQATKNFAPRSALAPTVSETRVTRMPDGSLVLTCNDRPNPKAVATIQATRSPHAAPDRQP